MCEITCAPNALFGTRIALLLLAGLVIMFFRSCSYFQIITLDTVRETTNLTKAQPSENEEQV